MCVSAHQWAEYILFASLLVLVCIIFAIMAYFYTYTDPAKIEEEFAQNESEDKKRRKSLEMAVNGLSGQSKEKMPCPDEEKPKQTRI